MSPLLAAHYFDHQEIFYPFMIIWGLFGISGSLFFYFCRNAALKRRLWAPFVIVTGVGFGCFVAYIISHDYLQVLFLIIPMIAVISFINFRQIRFCGACGETLLNQPIFSRSQFCPRCDAELR
jgi:hypothetical protein